MPSSLTSGSETFLTPAVLAMSFLRSWRRGSVAGWSAFLCWLVGLVGDLVELLLELRLDLRLRLGLRLGRRHALRPRAARRSGPPACRPGSWPCPCPASPLGDLVEVGLIGLGRLLGHVDADQEGAVRARPESGRQPVAGAPRVGALGHRAVVLLPEVDVERRQREHHQHDDRDERARQRSPRDEPTPAHPAVRTAIALAVRQRNREPVDPVADDPEDRGKQRDRRRPRPPPRPAPTCSRAS